MWRTGLLVALWIALAGCQTTHEQLLAQGYPPAFADGFSDGCSSGRQAAGVITGAFKKDVPRYLKDANYAEGRGARCAVGGGAVFAFRQLRRGAVLAAQGR